jgi:hypothetical protein
VSSFSTAARSSAGGTGRFDRLWRSTVAAPREQARERVEGMPAETALGHADPQGPSDEDPEQWEAEHPSPVQ